MKILSTLILFFSFNAFAQLDCEAVKVLNSNSPKDKIEIPIAMVAGPVGPFSLFGEVDGLIFQAMAVPDNIMFHQNLNVSIRRSTSDGIEVFSSNGVDKALVTYMKMNAQMGEVVLYGLNCTFNP